MIKTALLAIAIMASFSVAQAQPRLIYSAVTNGFDRCDKATTPGLPSEVIANKGVVRIVLPRHLDLSNIKRWVKIDSGTFNEATDNGSTDLIGAMNPDQTIEGEPFHAFLKHDLFPMVSPNPTSAEYILVRIIIRRNSDYSFYDAGVGANGKTIHGVGWGVNPVPPGEMDTVFCGVKDVITAATNPLIDSPRQVASFYIRARYLKTVFDGSINIGLRPNEAPDTPIFIDPKIHNEG